MNFFEETCHSRYIITLSRFLMPFIFFFIEDLFLLNGWSVFISCINCKFWLWPFVVFRHSDIYQIDVKFVLVKLVKNKTQIICFSFLNKQNKRSISIYESHG